MDGTHTAVPFVRVVETRCYGTEGSRAVLAAGARFSQPREDSGHRPEIIRQPRSGTGPSAFVYHMHLRIPFVVIYSRVQHVVVPLARKLVTLDTHHYTTEFDPLFF